MASVVEESAEGETLRTTCAVVGGGPAGLVLGLLLARAGVEVTVLEKHADFLRDFSVVIRFIRPRLLCWTILVCLSVLTRCRSLMCGRLFFLLPMVTR